LPRFTAVFPTANPLDILTVTKSVFRFVERVYRANTYISTNGILLSEIMLIQFTDYNSADEVIAQNYLQEWEQIESMLTEMPLYLKASDQKGKEGQPNFDPVGTNQFISDYLKRNGWLDTIPITPELDALGTDLDFGKNGILMEAQFSNYPFLLNNVVRSEVLFRNLFQIGGTPVKLGIIITKGHMFPSSNSTLYYEQAMHQIDFLDQFKIIDIPLRLIGLFEAYSNSTSAVWTKYHNTRYSRTVTKRDNILCEIQRGRNGKNGKACRAKIQKK